MSIGQWLADNLIPWALAGVAFVGSYSHLVALGQTHGVHGALAHTTAGCVDAIVAMASRGATARQAPRSVCLASSWWLSSSREGAPGTTRTCPHRGTTPTPRAPETRGLDARTSLRGLDRLGRTIANIFQRHFKRQSERR